ncbi:MAG: hypothetical protein ACPGR8_16840, partial [Limisphaerales bacterium]
MVLLRYKCDYTPAGAAYGPCGRRVTSMKRDKTASCVLVPLAPPPSERKLYDRLFESCSADELVTLDRRSYPFGFGPKGFWNSGSSVEATELNCTYGMYMYAALRALYGAEPDHLEKCAAAGMCKYHVEKVFYVKMPAGTRGYYHGMRAQGQEVIDRTGFGTYDSKLYWWLAMSDYVRLHFATAGVPVLATIMQEQTAFGAMVLSCCELPEGHSHGKYVMLADTDTPSGLALRRALVSTGHGDNAATVDTGAFGKTASEAVRNVFMRLHCYPGAAKMLQLLLQQETFRALFLQFADCPAGMFRTEHIPTYCNGTSIVISWLHYLSNVLIDHSERNNATEYYPWQTVRGMSVVIARTLAEADPGLLVQLVTKAVHINVIGLPAVDFVHAALAVAEEIGKPLASTLVEAVVRNIFGFDATEHIPRWMAFEEYFTSPTGTIGPTHRRRWHALRTLLWPGGGDDLSGPLSRLFRMLNLMGATEVEWLRTSTYSVHRKVKEGDSCELVRCDPVGFRSRLVRMVTIMIKAAKRYGDVDTTLTHLGAPQAATQAASAGGSMPMHVAVTLRSGVLEALCLRRQFGRFKYTMVPKDFLRANF